MPPQITVLGHKDYFELKAIENQKWQRVLSLPLISLKPGHNFPL